MRTLLVISGILAIVLFLIGFVISLFILEFTWNERLIFATTFAAIFAFCTLFAAQLLGSRDSNRHSSTMQQVRDDLLDCEDSSDEQFLSCKPCEDARLLFEIRNAISQFFDVPASKVGRDVHLIRDLQIDKLDLPFQLTVIGPVIATRQLKPRPYAFSTTNLTSIDDLVSEILNVLK